MRKETPGTKADAVGSSRVRVLLAKLASRLKFSEVPHARAMRVETHQPYRNITVRHRPLWTPKSPHYGRGRRGGPFELRKSAQMRRGPH